MATFEQDALKRLLDPSQPLGGTPDRANSLPTSAELDAAAPKPKWQPLAGEPKEDVPDGLPPADSAAAAPAPPQEAGTPTEVKNYADTRWTDDERKRLYGELKKLGNPDYKLETQFGPITTKQLESEMLAYKRQIAAAQQAYSEANDRIVKAEIADKIMEAVTYLAAGIHGMKTGVDVSGVKYNPIDWSKRYARESDKFKGEIDRLKAERDYQESLLSRMDKEREWKRRGFQDELSEIDRKRSMLNDFDMAQDRRERSEEAANTKWTMQEQARRDRAEKDMRSLLVKADDDKASDKERENAIAAAKGIWVTKLGGDVSAFDTKVEKWWGLGERQRTGTEILTDITAKGGVPDIGAQPVGPRAAAAASIPSGEVKVREKATGAVGSIPRENLKAAIESGQYEVVK